MCVSVCVRVDQRRVEVAQTQVTGKDREGWPAHLRPTHLARRSPPGCSPTSEKPDPGGGRAGGGRGGAGRWAGRGQRWAGRAAAAPGMLHRGGCKRAGGSGSRPAGAAAAVAAPGSMREPVGKSWRLSRRLPPTVHVARSRALCGPLSQPPALYPQLLKPDVARSESPPALGDAPAPPGAPQRRPAPQPQGRGVPASPGGRVPAP